jgi:ATP-binding cassette subfamily F protein 3
MLAVSNLSKAFGSKPILKNVSFTVKNGQRASLVGPNGSGKTTLFRILAGVDSPDSGSVLYTPRGIPIGYLPQGLQYSPDETIGKFIASRQGNPANVEQKLEELAQSLSLRPNDPALHDEYEHVLNRLTFLSQQQDRSVEILSELGLDRFTPETPVAFLSGGQKTRLSLAGILLEKPRFLLLDEPTNHLDIAMLEWLESFLIHSAYTMLVISHDRAFLDHVANHILELDPVSHTINEYVGNYTEYLDQKQAEQRHQWQEFTDQQDEISRLSSSVAHIRGIAKFRKGGKADSGDKFAKGFFANRGLETMRRAKSVEKRIDQLLNEDHIEKPGQTWQMKIEFDGAIQGARTVMVAENLSIGYPGNILATNIDVTLKNKQRAVLIGSNGSGKTTLIKTIAGLQPPITGMVRLGANIQLGYMTQEQETLKPEDTPLTTLSRILSGSETEVRSYLSKYLFKGDDVYTYVADMSYGERARLSLTTLVAGGCNLLLLDEPINHLDIPARVRFEEALASYEGTVVAVVHDRYFIDRFATSIWEIKNGSIQIIA